ncbi:MAG TPA: Mur ligase family protein [Actinomycetota bacterium]|nr:Mur ligase family protein [Actinomycetota bacterium]
MRFEEAVADLDARSEGRMIPTLDRIRQVVDLMGNPQHVYPTVHVAGTNGKTTTTRLIERVLCASGVSAGALTSPHLENVRERLTLCGDPIEEQEFAETYAHLRLFLEEVDRKGERVTYFETLAALAALWFADKPVEVGVFEVGMGGSWDATNVIRSEVAVVTPIGLDHPELGSTIEEVAGEKAGILKEGTTAVVREQRPEARAVLEARAAEVGATLLHEGEDFGVPVRDLAVGGQRLAIRGLRGEYRGLTLPLHGEHAARNAAAAVAAAELVLDREVGAEAVREALAGASSPGRVEVLSRHPLIVLDGAHNPDGAAALAAALGEAFIWERLFLVLAVLDTKDADGIAAALAPRTTSAFVGASSHPRAMDPDRLTAVAERAGIPAIAHATVDAALDAAEAAAGPDDLIVVTGSLYTVADARPRYLKG